MLNIVIMEPHSDCTFSSHLYLERSLAGIKGTIHKFCGWNVKMEDIGGGTGIEQVNC
jgi:hypothetical protein